MTLTFGRGSVVIDVERGLSTRFALGGSFADAGSGMSGEVVDSTGVELIEIDGMCGGLSGGCSGKGGVTVIKGQAVWCARRRVEVQIYVK